MKRIRIFALSLTFCFASYALGQQTPTLCIDNWSEFHRSNMQRWNPCESTLSVTNVGGLQLKWMYNVGEQGQQNNSPAVENGVVYVGSADGNVYALKAETGAPLWTRNIGSQTSSPAVANGVVYVGTETQSAGFEGTFYALDSATGNQLWSFPFGEDMTSNPASVVDGVVYFNASLGQTGEVYALNANTGAVIWSQNSGEDISSALAVSGGVVYLGFEALDAVTGAVLWDVGSEVYSPAVANGLVYVGGNDRRFWALKTKDGNRLWSRVLGAPLYTSPAVANGMVYVGSDDGGILALNAETGERVWRYVPGPSTTAPAVANGVVYFGGGNNVYALNAATGEVLWTDDTDGDISSPAVTHGMVFVGSHTGQLYAFGLPSKKD
jgi:outer membrane protein assembly factor BamB